MQHQGRGLRCLHYRMRQVNEAVEEDGREEVSGEQKWNTIRDSVVKEAENAVGYEKRRQPDWFKEVRRQTQQLVQSLAKDPPS